METLKKHYPAVIEEVGVMLSEKRALVKMVTPMLQPALSSNCA